MNLMAAVMKQIRVPYLDSDTGQKLCTGLQGSQSKKGPFILYYFTSRILCEAWADPPEYNNLT